MLKLIYLERDVFIAHADLQLLSPILVLLWPLRVVLPEVVLD